MRTIVKKAGVIAMGVGLVLGAAVAASADERAPEARAYVGFSFGGSEAAPRDFHYGLRIDQDSRYSGKALPPMLQLDYTARGMNDLRVNGVSAVRQDYRLRQAEEAATEEVVDEPGFFEKIGNWFGGLFGGDDEDAAGEAAETAEAPVEEEEVPTDGSFLGYTAIDWGLVAVGAVGLGFVATEVVNGEDKLPPSTTSPTTTPTTTPTTLPTVVPTVVPTIAATTVPTVVPTVASGLNRGIDGFLLVPREDPEHQEWLDGGTGHMGDLGG